MESNDNNNQNHNHNEEEASREEEAAAGNRELVVIRRRRVIQFSASLSHSSSSSSTHDDDDEIIAEYPFTYVVAGNVIAIFINRGSTTDDEESLRPLPPPDLPIEVIEGLLKKVEVIDNGDVCAICMDELKVNDEARAIGHCSHTFHLDCVAEWVKRKPTCPLCRFEIPINGT